LPKVYRSDPVVTGVDVELTKPIKDNPANLQYMQKKEFCWNLTMIHAEYKSSKEKGTEKISSTKFINFLTKYFEIVAHRILFQGFIFILPFGMGRFYMQKSNKKYYLDPNRHTFRKYYHLRWDKDYGKFKNRAVWKFKSSKEIRYLTADSCFGKESHIVERKIKDLPVGHNYRGIEGKFKDRPAKVDKKYKD
jgi:hypothetical protein